MVKTVRAVLARRPQRFVIIDSPGYSFGCAFRASLRPLIPSSNYVSPSVWAWRSGRARSMKRYIDTCWRCCRSSPACTASWRAALQLTSATH